MKAFVVNVLGRGFDLEDIDIAAPMAREVLVEVKAAGLCHTDVLFATHGIVPMPAVLGHEVADSGWEGCDQRHDGRSAGALGRFQILRFRP